MKIIVLEENQTVYDVFDESPNQILTLQCSVDIVAEFKYHVI